MNQGVIWMPLGQGGEVIIKKYIVITNLQGKRQPHLFSGSSLSSSKTFVLHLHNVGTAHDRQSERMSAAHEDGIAMLSMNRPTYRSERSKSHSAPLRK
jgi:hypothetical protein